MSEAEKLYGEEHVRRYRETGGEVGHIWKEGSTILLLTTTGRKSGRAAHDAADLRAGRRPVRDRRVARAARRSIPGWYRNLDKTPEVELQVKDDVFPARARTAEGEERERLWQKANEVWPHYDGVPAEDRPRDPGRRARARRPRSPGR